MTSLSILIPTLPNREKVFNRLVEQLKGQAERYCSTLRNQPGYIDIASDSTIGISIGAKRNILLQGCQSDYLCFFDDDDLPSNDYISLIMEGIATNPDCCSLVGEITFDGKNPRPFRHSIEYTEIDEQGILYRRPVNHLNAVRSSIAKQMTFPDWNYSEDSNYCFQLQASGLLRTEHKIEKCIYHYLYCTDKKNKVYE